ncbi:MAG TPA: hypothetical protein VM913_09130 [Sphingomicrobium sp.]|jgi:hypothetical protein|nr:hypothetical protein [Sphingomicrobium sp.]
MSRLLFASAAALCVAAVPASASAQLSGGVQVHVGSGAGPSVADRHGRDGDRRRGRGRDTIVLGGYGYSPDWGYYNNRSFAPDSFNDWWHDRADRSLPRWVGQNANCERQWFSGAGWRC